MSRPKRLRFLFISPFPGSLGQITGHSEKAWLWCSRKSKRVRLILANAAHVNLEHMPAPGRRTTHSARDQARSLGAARRRRNFDDLRAPGQVGQFRSTL
jgi:hypothetical protein